MHFEFPKRRGSKLAKEHWLLIEDFVVYCSGLEYSGTRGELVYTILFAKQEMVTTIIP